MHLFLVTTFIFVSSLQGCVRSGQFHANNDGPNIAVDSSRLRLTTSGGVVCAIKADRKVICWKDSFSWIEAADEEFIDISISYSYGCGIKTDGTALCWEIGKKAGDKWGLGRVLNDQVPLGKKFKKIAAGLGKVCGIEEGGEAACWHPYGQSAAPNDKFIAISASINRQIGHSSTCGITEDDGRIKCWGSDSNKIISKAPTDAGFTSLSIGENCACAISDGTITCWGSCSKTFPAKNETKWKFTSVGYGIMCAIDQNNKVKCFQKFKNPDLIPPPPEDFLTISCSWPIRGEFVCGILTNNTIKCWGKNFPSKLATPQSLTD